MMDDIRGTSILDLPDGSLEEVFAAKVGQGAIKRITDIMGLSLDIESTECFENDLMAALDAFLEGQFSLVSHRSLKEENKVLDDVRKHSDALYTSLLSLFDHGQSTRKLAQEVKSNATKYTAPSGIILADLLDNNRANPFRSLREFLSDLSISAERSIVRKPKADTAWDIEDEMTDEEIESYVEPPQFKDVGSLPTLEKQYALRCVIFTFKEIWGKYSEQPFTEGMYYPETKSTISLTVDAIEIFMKNLDPSVTRQNIVSAIRWLKTNELPKFGYDGA